MAIVFAPLNKPYDEVDLGIAPDGRAMKMCFFQITFDTTSVGGVAGQQYDVGGSHFTTNVTLGLSPGKSTPKDIWGVTKISRMVFFNGSSDFEVATLAGATSNCGEVKAEYVPSGTYIKLSAVGAGISGGNGFTVDEAEITSVAGNMSAIRLTGYLIGG